MGFGEFRQMPAPKQSLFFARYGQKDNRRRKLHFAIAYRLREAVRFHFQASAAITGTALVLMRGPLTRCAF